MKLPISNGQSQEFQKENFRQKLKSSNFMLKHSFVLQRNLLSEDLEDSGRALPDCQTSFEILRFDACLQQLHRFVKSSIYQFSWLKLNTKLRPKLSMSNC